MCAYCEQKLESIEKLSIDHFKKRDLFPEETLEYINLFNGHRATAAAAANSSKNKYPTCFSCLPTTVNKTISANTPMDQNNPIIVSECPIERQYNVPKPYKTE
jgi:uncharacterized protein (TIGR02646 family)